MPVPPHCLLLSLRACYAPRHYYHYVIFLRCLYAFHSAAATLLRFSAARHGCRRWRGKRYAAIRCWCRFAAAIADFSCFCQIWRCRRAFHAATCWGFFMIHAAALFVATYADTLLPLPLSDAALMADVFDIAILFFFATEYATMLILRCWHTRFAAATLSRLCRAIFRCCRCYYAITPGYASCWFCVPLLICW